MKISEAAHFFSIKIFLKIKNKENSKYNSKKLLIFLQLEPLHLFKHYDKKKIRCQLKNVPGVYIV